MKSIITHNYKPDGFTKQTAQNPAEVFKDFFPHPLNTTGDPDSNSWTFHQTLNLSQPTNVIMLCARG